MNTFVSMDLHVPNRIILIRRGLAIARVEPTVNLPVISANTRRQHIVDILQTPFVPTVVHVNPLEMTNTTLKGVHARLPTLDFIVKRFGPKLIASSTAVHLESADHLHLEMAQMCVYVTSAIQVTYARLE
mmetsp:Transcript_11694/g.17161  ORF Transcript_11694/g.17161 Transcript_11694/m.17161 type:complete len:130 (-) Transcript_11694:659-1048(-)